MGKKIDKLKRRIRKEWAIKDNLRAGYPRRTASKWYNICRKDSRMWRKVYSAEKLDAVHARGYLAKNISRLGLKPDQPCERITDLDYLFLQPLNNSYEKWLGNLNTMNRMFPAFSEYMPRVYYSVFNRDGLHVLSWPSARTETRIRDILKTLQKEGELQLRPSFFESEGRRYTLSYIDRKRVRVNRSVKTLEQFRKFLRSLKKTYVICEPLRFDYPLEEGWNRTNFLKLYMANDTEEGTKLLFAVAEVFNGRGKATQYPINREDGSFDFPERIKAPDGTMQTEVRTIRIPHWKLVADTIQRFAEAVSQISFFTVSVVLTESGFKISKCNTDPVLPRIMPNAELNDYLLGRVAQKKAVGQTTRQKITAIRNSLEQKALKKRGKKGIRPYMQKLWEESLEADKKWPGTTMEQKKWCWERGFFSWRIPQYGLTEENYKNFLSDYQYHWLNRINGVYQGWINDKLTFRYIMEPFKQYIPSYYFSVFKSRGQTKTARLMDCPVGIENTMAGICALLRQEKQLAFKAAAGTHGDGFYALEYDPEAEIYLVNGAEYSEEELVTLLESQRSFYVVTSYIHMHPELKRIYPKSVNSIRMMLVNEQGYNPRILQTYMRIGSSKTGYTDNVGYGGICAMIDAETGVIYNPETIVNHEFFPCPTHPDTGVEIAGIQIPHWQEVCRTVCDICRYIPDLEYLGFDVAVTEEGFQIMEINIHQDLHKVALYSDEIMDYFRRKIRYKERQNRLPYSV